MEISNNFSAKYYQENKERLQKKACERYENLSKEEKESNNMVVKITKDIRKTENKSLLSIKKKILEWAKTLYNSNKKVL